MNRLKGSRFFVLRLSSSVFCLLSSVLFLFAVQAGAQDDPMAPPPPDGGMPPVSSPAVQTPSPVLDQPAAPKKESEEWEQELLRDPFWPVGFYPPNWQKRSETQGGADNIGSSGWKTAASKLQISGTSRLGGRTAAIINGELKGEGEKVEVLHEGRMYQWEIIGIDASGQIQLKKLGIR